MWKEKLKSHWNENFPNILEETLLVGKLGGETRMSCFNLVTKLIPTVIVKAPLTEYVV